MKEESITIQIDSDESLDEAKLAEKLGVDPGAPGLATVVATIKSVQSRMAEPGTYLGLLIDMAAYLEKSADACKKLTIEAVNIEDREQREQRAHDTLHLGFDRLTSMMSEMLANMPCQRDDDELPDDCTTRH